jgi:hypothetical protein
MLVNKCPHSLKFTLLLFESLHKRFALLDGQRTIPLSDWARAHGVSPAAAANRAKRQTIPAFRLRGRWRIPASCSGEVSP